MIKWGQSLTCRFHTYVAHVCMSFEVFGGRCVWGFFFVTKRRKSNGKYLLQASDSNSVFTFTSLKSSETVQEYIKA